MIEIKTETVINTNVEHVWRALTSIGSFQNWNRFMTSVIGDLHVGSQLTVTIVPPGSQPSTFTPTVVKLDAKEHEFRWVGILLFERLFRGEHYFQLIAIDENTTRLIHGEQFTGLFSPLILWLIKDATLAGFQLMNQCLGVEAVRIASPLSRGIR